MFRTRVAYGIGKKGTYRLCDTVEEALKANMFVSEYEKELQRINPQLKIIFKVEAREIKK